MEIKIIKNHPITAIKTKSSSGVSKVFMQMEIGDSFDLPCKNSEVISIRGRIAGLAIRRGLKLVTRYNKEKQILSVWKVERQ